MAYYVSDAVKATFLSSHTAVARVDIINTAVGSAAAGVKASTRSNDFSISSGSVQLQRGASVRRTVTVELILESYSVFRDALDPRLGYQLKPYRGFVADATAAEVFIPLGVFVIDTCTINRLADGRYKYRATGYDRSKVVDRNTFTSPVSFASGTTYTSAINTIYSGRVGTAFDPIYVAETVATTLPGTVTFSENDSPWSAIQTLSDSIGCDTFFDQDGVLRTQTIPDPSTVVPIIDIASDTLGVQIGALSETYSISETFNAVYVNGSAPWLLFSVQGLARDEDPASPTYYLGPFGLRPKIIQSALVTDVTQANSVAAAELSKILGRTRKVDFTILPLPFLDIGDVVRTADQESRRYARHIVDSLQIPIIGNSMSGSLRQFKESAF